MSFGWPPRGPPWSSPLGYDRDPDIENMLHFFSMMSIIERARRMQDLAISSAVMGKQALDDEDFDNAEQFLRKAYILFHSLPGNEIIYDLCEVLQNLIILHHKKCLYEKALPFVDELVVIRPDYQSFFLAGKTLLFLEKMLPAFNLFGISHNLRNTDKEGVDSLLEIVNILVTSRGSIESIRPEVTIQTPLTIWKEIVRRLSEDNKWEAINILMGLSTPGSVLDGLAKGCGTEDVNVGLLLENLGGHALASWGQKLAVALLKEGASLDSVKDKDDEPLHASLKLGLRTGSFEVLKYVLQKLPEDSDNKDQVDEMGDSAFHVVVKSGEANTTMGETAIRLLLNHECRADIKDKDGKLPVDYLNPTDQVYTLLQNATKEPGDVSSRLIYLRETGKRCMQNKAYSDALRHYTKGIRLASDQETLRHELAVFYSNRSAVYSKLSQQQEALADAEACIANAPTWPKGYWRKGQILKSTGRYSDAFITFQRGYECEKQTEDSITCLVDAVSVLSKIKHYQQFLETLEMEDKSAMTSVVQNLSKKSDWWALKLLVLSGSTTMDGISRVAQGTTATGVNLGGLAKQIKTTDHVTDNWRYDLLCALLSMGACPSTLVTESGDTPYHAALKLALHMEDVEVLEIVLSACDNQLDIMAAVDKRGDNLLHTLVKSSKVGCRIAEIVAEFLAKEGVNPLQRDRQGKHPVEYLPVTSELKAIILRVNDHKHRS